MAEKVIMLGNEAIARGAYEAGVKVSSAYPGTPSTEISEYLVQYKDDVYEEWRRMKKWRQKWRSEQVLPEYVLWHA